MRRHLPTFLAILSFPVALVVYLVTGAVIAAVAPSLVTSIVGIFVPLFVAGLSMIPFVAPWFDAKAKADLEHIRAIRAAEEKGRGTPPRG